MNWSQHNKHPYSTDPSIQECLQSELQNKSFYACMLFDSLCKERMNYCAMIINKHIPWNMWRTTARQRQENKKPKAMRSPTETQDIGKEETHALLGRDFYTHTLYCQFVWVNCCEPLQLLKGFAQIFTWRAFNSPVVAIIPHTPLG